MASTFPGGVDNLANNVTNATAEYDTHPQLHNDVADAVVAVQTSLRPGGALSLEDHAAAADPHPGYLERTDADATYQTPAQADARYLSLGGGTLVGPLEATEVEANGRVTPGNGTLGGSGLWSGDGVPDDALGSDGDFFFRRDTVSTPLQRIYVRSAGTWSGIV